MERKNERKKAMKRKLIQRKKKIKQKKKKKKNDAEMLYNILCVYKYTREHY